MAMVGVGSEIRGQRWIVVTALVPLERQEVAFSETFKNCVFYDADGDYPEYLGYWVERVETALPENAENPEWEKAKIDTFPQAGEKAMKEWTLAGNPEVAAPEYLHEKLTFPLGPLVGRVWGESGTPPEILLRTADKPKLPAFLLLRYFDFSVEPGRHYVYRVRLGLRNPNYEMSPTRLKDPELAKPKYLATPWSDPSPVISVPCETRVLLVSVAPGRSTREPSGRVMVTKWVEKKGIEAHNDYSMVRGQVADFPKQKFRPIKAPAAGPGLMGGMPPGVGTAPPGPPPRRRGRAGDRASGGGRALPPPDVMLPAGLGRMPVPVDAANEIDLDYITAATVVDFRGGGSLARRRGNSLYFNSAGEMLLLNPDGVLVVRNELDDEPACKELVKAETELAEQKPAVPADPSGKGLEGLGGPLPSGRRSARRVPNPPGSHGHAGDEATNAQSPQTDNAQQRQQREAAARNVPMTYVNSAEIRMVFIPSGVFYEGRNKASQRQRPIDRPFYLADCEVTQGQCASCCASSDAPGFCTTDGRDQLVTGSRILQSLESGREARVVLPNCRHEGRRDRRRRLPPADRSRVGLCRFRR